MTRYKTHRARILQNFTSGLVFVCALAVYLLTADSSVSYWDCPEYVTCASTLQIGHPPGNPAWMLAMRVLTIPFPAHLHAYAINLASGLFMALAAFFLARIAYDLTLWTAMRYKSPRRLPRYHDIEVMAAAVSTGTALCFAFCDSTWFSAVEAEVYAMSACLTSFAVWLMLVWAQTPDPGQRRRLLILEAYVTGLSLGVHQLNLLVIPVLALIWVYRRHPGRGATLRAWRAIAFSFILIVLVLLGMMPGALALATRLELLCVNTLGLPWHTGAVAYAVITPLLFATALALTSRNSAAALPATALALWASGCLVFGSAIWRGLAAAVLLTAALHYLFRLSPAVRLTSLWCLAMTWLGYSVFALLAIRGAAAPPMNEGAPTDIFALQRYVAREQYGSTPLLRGRTPMSRPLLEESADSTGHNSYKRYALTKGKPRYVLPPQGTPRLNHRSGFVTHDDSVANARAVADGAKYILADYSFSQVTAPELDMWLPRITDTRPAALDSYADWAGMTAENMQPVLASDIVRPDGVPDGRLQPDGSRRKSPSRRPTYMQNLRFLLSYQLGYMYFRYLLWNFAGRQNDLPSTGEIDHGNFVTGFGPLDDAMLGPQDKMPSWASSDNKGRNIYWCIPLLLGLAGIVLLLRGGRTGRRTLALTALWFIMTGPAIALYLNQTPGEPRERDYAFIGSYMAYCIWTGFGMAAVAFATYRLTRSDLLRSVSLVATTLGVPLLMLWQNLDDHDRSGRSEASLFARDILEGLPDGIIVSQGDNFTFPLWYSRETEGYGRGHTVIDASYLASPDYVVNLMRQSADRPLFTASAADVAFGAYSFTRLPADLPGDTVPLLKALHSLYSTQNGTPVMPARWVTLPGATRADTLVLDLRGLAPNGLLSFKTLMTLDLLATAADGRPTVPVHFLSHLPVSLTAPARGATHPTAYSDTYDPDMGKRRYADLLHRQATDLTRKIPLPSYLDPVLADARRRRRGAAVRIARIWSDAGHTQAVSPLLRAAFAANDPHDVVPGSFTVADSTFYETHEALRLLENLPDASPADQALGDTLRAVTDRDRMQWTQYWRALPPDRRHALSPDTRRRLSKF